MHPVLVVPVTAQVVLELLEDLRLKLRQDLVALVFRWVRHRGAFRALVRHFHRRRHTAMSWAAENVR